MCQSQSPNLFPPAYPLVTRDHSTPGSSVLHCLPKFAQVHRSIKLVMLSNHLILCRPFLLWLSVFPSIRVFSNKLALHIRWPKYWSFRFSICPSNEYSGLTSFRIDWFYLLGRKAMTNLDSILKGRDYHFANISQYTQSYGFSSSHVQMWELDHIEGKPPKNWCFQIVLQEKILESLGQQGDQTSQS